MSVYVCVYASVRICNGSAGGGRGNTFEDAATAAGCGRRERDGGRGGCATPSTERSAQYFVPCVIACLPACNDDDDDVDVDVDVCCRPHSRLRRRSSVLCLASHAMKLGDDFPDFEVDTSLGPDKLKWHEYIDGKWAILF